MSDKYDDIVRRLEAVETELREVRAQKRSQVFGTRDVPVQTIFLKDNKTGSIAEVDYDSSTSDVRISKVR